MLVRTGISAQQGLISVSVTKKNHMSQGLGNIGEGGGGGGGGKQLHFPFSFFFLSSKTL